MALSKIQTKEMLDTPNLGRRNLIINGAMEVSQRGSSFALTATEQYTLDRFIGTSYGGNTVTFSQDGDAPSTGNFFTSIKLTNSGTTAAGSGSFYSVRQLIEGYVLRPLRMGQSDAKSFTVSFWVKSSVAPSIHTVGIINGALNRSNRSEFTINNANTWEHKSVTFTGDTTGTWATNNTKAMYVDIVVSHGTGNSGTPNTWTANSIEGTSTSTNTWCSNNGATFYVTGLQLESGTKATPFESRSFAEELHLCQRYFFTNGYGSVTPGVSGGYSGIAFDTAETAGGMSFPAVMRTNPTITLFDTAGNSGRTHRNRSGDHPNACTPQLVSQNGFLAFTSTGLADGKGYCGGVTANAEL